MSQRVRAVGEIMRHETPGPPEPPRPRVMRVLTTTGELLKVIRVVMDNNGDYHVIVEVDRR